MKKLIFTGGIAAILIAVAAVWLHAAPPTVGAMTATPSYIVVNTPTAVVFTIQITDPSLLPNGVNLLRVDASGKTLGIVGVMHDDGVNGDATANDKVFSFRVNADETSVGQVYYQVSAPFKGLLKRVLSVPIAIHVDPIPLPPDPGEAGKLTLEGIDSDHDGVRDDVQRYIAITYPTSEPIRKALTQYAVSLQLAMQTDPNPTTIAQDQIASVRCIAYTVGDTGGHEWVQVSAALRSVELNTADRFKAYATLRQAAPSDPLPDSSTTDSELGRYCRQ